MRDWQQFFRESDAVYTHTHPKFIEIEKANELIRTELAGSPRCTLKPGKYGNVDGRTDHEGRVVDIKELVV